jgi:N-methylhydantoinase B/oxoprolinase/acetone carboxylase alpha subunit
LHEPAQVSLLSERRKTKPYGLAGGECGENGENLLIRNGKGQKLPGKGSFDIKPNDILSIRTPGGGGYGKKEL